MNQIARYENGISDPVSETLRVIAQVLGVTADYLLGLSYDSQTPAIPGDLGPNEREMLDAYRRDGWLGVIQLGAEQLLKANNARS